LYLYHLFEEGRSCLSPVLRPLERAIYKGCGIKEDQEQGWIGYTLSMLAFVLVGLLLLYLIERLQGILPLNPNGFGPLEPGLAWNTAVSFATTTNWQAYAGEQTMSYLTQMMGLAVQNFTASALGLALALVIVRGFTRHSASTLGNFWVDITRAILYLLLPLCIIGALLLVWQGTIQNFNAPLIVHTLEGQAQALAQGPVAKQEIIRVLGTNGGGFFTTNAAHPIENPTPFSNLLEMVANLLVPAGLISYFGKMTGNLRQGLVLFGVMLALMFLGAELTIWAEQAGNPLLKTIQMSHQTFQIDQSAHTGLISSSGGTMEGKEVRFGITSSGLLASTETVTSTGALSSAADSYTPLGGLVLLTNMGLGEVIFGGIGPGLYGMLLFVVIAVFVAGLMVGRTPEYLEKKIDPKEMKLVALALLLFALSILAFAAVASVLPGGVSQTYNHGPHGLSEILYAFTSVTGNNGSAFAGLAANTPFYNWALGIAMLIGRFFFTIPLLAVAGSLVKKRVSPPGAGTLDTTGQLFGGFLTGVILLVGALTFLPAFELWPIVEHLLMLAGKLF
jgi:K+-transporting ATPase ATPase A chain